MNGEEAYYVLQCVVIVVVIVKIENSAASQHAHVGCFGFTDADKRKVFTEDSVGGNRINLANQPE